MHMNRAPWYVKDPKKLSQKSVLEYMLNFGEWTEIQEFIRQNGIHKTKDIFRQITSSKRSNLRKPIQDYFKRYFHHAS